MRLAVLSDIHGNGVAFDAVLADAAAQRVDAYVCLGDVAQGGPQPGHCLDRLRALACPVVLGNSDEFLHTLDAGDEPPERRRRLVEVAEWTVAQLDDAELEFQRSFQPTVTVDLGAGRTLVGFHGSPRSFDEILLPELSDGELRERLGGATAAFLAGGHVHRQWLRRLADGSRFLNPGSVGVVYDPGQPEDAFFLDSWAEYAIVTAGSHSGVEFRRVPYDLDDLRRVLLASGKPYAREDSSKYR